MNRLTDAGWKRLLALCRPPWEGDDEDAVRYRAEERRKQDDDRDWARERDRRSGAFFE